MPHFDGHGLETLAATISLAVCPNGELRYFDVSALISAGGGAHMAANLQYHWRTCETKTSQLPHQCLGARLHEYSTASPRISEGVLVE